MIGVDFIIEMDNRIGLVVGWADQAELLAPVLRSGNDLQHPQNARFFERADLKDRVADGFLFFFRLPASLEGLKLEVGELVVEIPPERLNGDFASFVRGCVDEVFCEFVLTLIEGDASISDPRKFRLVRNRLLAYQPSKIEDAQAAVSMDNAAYCSALGFGICSGWILKTDELTTRVRSFVLEEDSLREVTINENALHHYGLQDYPETFVKTGMDGYFCLLEPLASGPPPAKAFVVVRGERRGYLVNRPIRATGRQNMMRYIEDIALLKSHSDLVERHMRLGRSLDPAIAAARACSLSGPVQTDRIVLLLDHDASDPDVREVLRLVLSDYDGRIALQPVASTVGPKFRQALRGAIEETGGGRIELLPPTQTPDFRQLAREAAVLVYGRSSTLIQLGGLPASLAAVARGKALSAVIHDPFLRGAGIEGEAPLDTALGAIIGRSAPFHAAIRSDLLVATYPEISGIFLALDARIRSLLMVLAQAGCPLDLRVSDKLHCFPGRRTMESKERESIAKVQVFHDNALFSSTGFGGMA